MDRRAHARQPTVPNRAALEWGTTTSDGGQEARVLDISRGGASLDTRCAPPAGQPIWFRMESPAATHWLSASVVRRDGASRLGVRFEQPCPDDVLMAATLGIALRL